MSRWRACMALAAMASLSVLSACSEKAPDVDALPRPVTVVLIEPGATGITTRITGDIQAQKEVQAAFRIAGKVTERPVNVGDKVEAGQLLARLDAETERNAVAAAQAAVEAAKGQVSKTSNAYDRQVDLLARGFTTRPRYDEARTAFIAAEASLEDAEAQLAAAKDRLSFTELRAEGDGVVTARGAEPGEVVQAGRMIVTIARGDGRDAVFDVPPRLFEKAPQDLVVDVALVADPNVHVTGSIREVSPQADPVTGTFRVRVGLDGAPKDMALGAPIVGSVTRTTEAVTSIPASALTAFGRDPAVWVVAPMDNTVTLRPVEIVRFEPSAVVVGRGLEPGDMVVTGGIQALHPGQQVRPLPFRTQAASAQAP
ncbi:MAG: efflux RND transporter periplasmic adaptor subunit [Hyphomicrobiales bacterium]